MAASHGTGASDEAEHRRQLRRAVLAATIGTAIEWYDFFLYSTVTGLVFARLYFPRADPFIGTLTHDDCRKHPTPNDGPLSKPRPCPDQQHRPLGRSGGALRRFGTRTWYPQLLIPGWNRS